LRGTDKEKFDTLYDFFYVNKAASAAAYYSTLLVWEIGRDHEKRTFEEVYNFAMQIASIPGIQHQMDGGKN